MSKVVLSVFRIHPFVVLAAYIFLIAGYRYHLDSSLKYIRPKLPMAPEDILGFGFWVPWSIFAIWLAIACFLSYRFGMERRSWYWTPILCIFVLLSVVDYYLYGVLERQVLAS